MTAQISSVDMLNFVNFVSRYSVEAKSKALEMIKAFRESKDVDLWNQGLIDLEYMGLNSDALTKFEIKEDTYERNSYN